MDALGFGLEVLLELRLRLQPLPRVGFRPDINVVQRGAQVRQHEGVRVLRAEVIAAFLGQVGLVALLVNSEE